MVNVISLRHIGYVISFSVTIPPRKQFVKTTAQVDKHILTKEKYNSLEKKKRFHGVIPIRTPLQKLRKKLLKNPW